MIMTTTQPNNFVAPKDNFNFTNNNETKFDQ